MRAIDAVLFDLDGTLIDSAPDLAGAANEQRAAHGQGPLPLARLRPMVGSGARGMLAVAFDIKPGAPDYAALREEFLAIYQRRLLQETVVFEAMQPVLDHLDDHSRRWGIVTNKALSMAVPITLGLGLQARAGVLIGGDSTPHTKPHPEPLWAAARQLGLAPERCVYVGDDARDIQAGRAAGMATLAAAWGYLGLAEPVERWGADAVLASPDELLQWLDMA